MSNLETRTFGRVEVDQEVYVLAKDVRKEMVVRLSGNEVVIQYVTQAIGSHSVTLHYEGGTLTMWENARLPFIDRV